MIVLHLKMTSLGLPTFILSVTWQSWKYTYVVPSCWWLWNLRWLLHWWC